MSDAATVTNIDTVYALATGRKTYHQSTLNEYDAQATPEAKEFFHSRAAPDENSTDKANLISSEVQNGMHMPVIDCDFGIQAVPSSTPGHYHLYIDRELTWPQYRALLDGLYKAGLIQEGWYENALKDKRSYVRLPHVKKLTQENTL